MTASGCAAYAADHVLGHSPRDSHEKQAELYPETPRAEYAKASWRPNVFSSFEKHLDSVATFPGANPGSAVYDNAHAGGRDAGAQALMHLQQQAMQSEIQKMRRDIADMAGIMLAGKNVDATPGESAEAEGAHRLRSLLEDGRDTKTA